MPTLHEMGLPSESDFDKIRATLSDEDVRRIGGEGLDVYRTEVREMVEAAAEVIEWGKSHDQDTLSNFATFYQAVIEECKTADMDPMHMFHTLLVAVYRGGEAIVRENALLEAIGRGYALADDWEKESKDSTSSTAQLVGIAVASGIRHALKIGDSK